MKPKIRALVATLAAAPVLALGGFAVAAHSATAPSSSEFYPMAPTRVIDTRGVPGSVGTGSTSLSMAAVVPAGATAVVVNITVVNTANAGGYVEAYPDGIARPVASTVNFAANQTIAGNATVELLDGSIDLYNSGPPSVNLIVDAEGYFGPPGLAPSSPPPSSPPATSASASPTVSGSVPASPSPSQTSATPSSSPSSTPPTNGSYIQPGSVGYRGSLNDLTVYAPGGAAPSGCSWQAYGLNCSDTSDTWDHVWIKSSVYWRGTGTLKVTNSVITGAPGTAGNWYTLLGHTPANQAYAGATLDVEDSTLSFSGTVPGNVDSAPVWSAYGNQRQIILRDDLSGMAQGIDPTDSSVIEDNYIHNLVQNGTGGTTVHLDGAFSQGGGNILIKGNYIDATHAPGAAPTSDTTAAVFIQDRGSTDTGISIQDNYLNGGAYVLRNQTGINVDVEGNTFGAGVYGLVGDLTGYPGTYGTWTGNVDSTGATVAKP